MRFLHTADWHLGMTRRFLPSEAQARFADDRIDAVREIARIAAAEGCVFVLACGDLFDSNHVDRQVVARAVDALGQFTVPVLILPGNHDPLDAASVYFSKAFTDRLPAGVSVIANSEPIVVADGVEVIGAPWLTRRPGRDLAAAALDGLAPPATGMRVLAAHGAVDVLAYAGDDPALVRIDPLRSALSSGAVSYVALGDRHSALDVGDDPRICYPGSPVATDHDEADPGKVLVVDVDATGATVTEHAVGRWTFTRITARLDGMDDVDRLDASLEAVPGKSRAVVRLGLTGSIGVAEDARLQQVLDHHREVLGSLTMSEGRSDLAVIIDEADIDALGLQGYARDAAAELVALAAGDGPQRDAAHDALRLLHRLAGAA